MKCIFCGRKINSNHLSVCSICGFANLDNGLEHLITESLAASLTKEQIEGLPLRIFKEYVKVMPEEHLQHIHWGTNSTSTISILCNRFPHKTSYIFDNMSMFTCLVEDKEQLDYIYERSNSDITKVYLEDIFKLLKLYEL